MSLEQALVRRNEELEEKVLGLEDLNAALKETLDNRINDQGYGYLSRTQNRFLKGIPMAPRYVSRDALMLRVYGHKVNPPQEKTMDVHIFKMRQRFAARQGPLWVQTIWGFGYALHKVDRAFWERIEGIKPALISHRTPQEINEELLGVTSAKILATDRRQPILPSHNQPSA